MKEILIIVAPIAVALLIIAVLVTWLILKSRYGKAVNAVENKLIAAQGEVKSLSALRENDLASHERSVTLLKEAHDAALKQQIAAIRAEMTAETERLLKQREEELSRKAEETFKTISGSLDKDLKEMKDAFDAQKKSHTESSASLKEQLELKKVEYEIALLKAKTDAIKSQEEQDRKYEEVIKAIASYTGKDDEWEEVPYDWEG